MSNTEILRLKVRYITAYSRYILKSMRIQYILTQKIIIQVYKIN